MSTCTYNNYCPIPQNLAYTCTMYALPPYITVYFTLPPPTHTHTLQAVYNVTKSPYPVQREELHALAGLQAAVLRAETRIETILDQTNVCKFYPTFMNVSLATMLFSSKPSAALRQTQEQFSCSFQSAYAECTDANQLKLKYLNKCWKHSMYGSVLFRGQIKKTPKAVHFLYYSDRQVHVAINRESVHILSASSPPVSQ